MFLNGIAINKVNLLLILCEQKDINIDLIKYFIEHGADKHLALNPEFAG